MRPLRESSTTVARALDQATRRLRQSGRRTPRLDAEVLLAHLLGCSRTRLYVLGPRELDPSLVRDFDRLLARRCAGEPVAYLVGWKEFYGRRFEVSPAVLVPRPETEFLVETGLRFLERWGNPRPRVADLGTGSGIVAVTLALEHPGAEVWASDISAPALEVARRNVERYGLEGRVHLAQGDLFEPLPPQLLDLVLSNPPYVGTESGPQPEPNVTLHEPRVALFSGPLGIEVVARIIEEAPRHLVDGGGLVLEMAPGQVERAEAMMVERGYVDTHLIPDLSGLPRVVLGRWEGA
jgi:release factor glutamine methyltransferase